MKQKYTLDDVREWAKRKASGMSYARQAQLLGLSRVRMMRIIEREVERVIVAARCERLLSVSF